jgi:TPR repeat protein
MKLMNAAYQLATTAFQRYLNGDQKVTRKLLRELDDANHAQASLVEGFIRLRHDRTLKDPESVFAAFKKASELGALYGKFYAGLCYANGYGITKNRKTAAKWYLKSADDGCINAMFALGTMYQRGEGVELNLQHALRLFERAATTRIIYSSRGRNGYCEDIRDFVYSEEKDVQLLAQEHLGELYHDESYGFPLDQAAARRWFDMAARNGSAYAKGQLKKLVPELPPVRPPVTWPTGLPVPPTDGGPNGIGRAEAFLRAQMHCSVLPPDYKLAAKYFLIAQQYGHPETKQALEAIKAKVGEQVFSQFFYGWSPAHHPEARAGGTAGMPGV